MKVKKTLIALTLGISLSFLTISVNDFFLENHSLFNIIVQAKKETDNDNKNDKKKPDSDSSSSDSKNNKNNKKNGSSSDGGTDNPTKIPMNEYDKPDHFWAWLQYYGPWAEKFGGGPKEGETWNHLTGSNQGCVSTSMAIQGARAGVDMTPNSLPKYAPLTFSKGSQHISRDGGTGDASGNLSESEALKECQKIASAGNYPLLRVGQKPGYGDSSNSHTMAYWKAGNGAPLYYDPSRFAKGTVFGGHIDYVGAEKVTGKGTKKFNPNSPGPGGNGASSSSSSKSGKGSSSGSGSGSSSGSGTVPAIKPTFNPFYTPMTKPIPADQQANQDENGAQIMEIADGLGPTILNWIRMIIYASAWFWAGLWIISTLIAITDVMFLGGFLQDTALEKASPLTKEILFPSGKFMGIDENKSSITAGNNPVWNIVWEGSVRYGFILIIIVITSSGALSMFTADIIHFVGELFANYPL